MKRVSRFGLLALVMVLGVTAAVLTLSSLSAAATPGQIDLSIRTDAPTHVAAGATYVVNVGYANLGWVPAPDNWVRVTLPEGTQFVSATSWGGESRPPAEVAGRVLTWHLELLVANSSWGHILVSVATQEGLDEGHTLETEVEIGGSTEDSNPDNNSATATTTVCYMGGSMKQVHARHAMPGDVLTYTIRVDLARQSGGGANGRWVTVTDTLPFSHQVRFLGWNGTVSGTLIDGHMLRWQGQVQAGDPLTLQYRLGVEGVVTPGVVISNLAMLGWDGHQMQLGPVTTVVTMPHGVMGLGPYQAGQVYHRHGVTLSVPQGAVSDTTRFQLGPLFTDTQPISPPGGLLFAHRAFEVNAVRFGEPVGHFNAPLTITVNYTDADVAGLKRETLRLWTRAGPGGPWTVLGEPARVLSGALSFTTTHLSQFALFGEAAPVADVDLSVRMGAPTYVDVGATYEVNVSYANLAWVPAHDNWVRVTLPEATQFVTATSWGGEPRPPDVQKDGVLTWNLSLLVANSGWGHILVSVATQDGLDEGHTLEAKVEIGGSEEDSNQDNNRATATSTVSSMGSSRMQGPGRHAMPADVLTYTITVHLTGPSVAEASGRQVTLTDTLPFSHQVHFLGWNGTVSGTMIDGHVLRWQGQVRAGEPLTFQYRLGVEGVVTPGEVISNQAMLGWDGHQMQLGPVTTVVTIPHGVMGLGPYQAGQVYHRHGVTLSVPPGAISDTTRFQLGPLFTDTKPISPPGGLLFAHRAFEVNAFRFGEPVGHFSAPLTITVSYTDADVAGLKRETLRLWTRAGPGGPWAMLGEPSGVTSGTLSFTTTHLSQFALFGEAKYRAYLPVVVR
ncbi:MAG: hypothetical protein ISS56_18210 [Anaerolineae bacterium]|nr:hypothetical protein [Anaerolineae bacterium]